MEYKDLIGTTGVGLLLFAYFSNLYSILKKEGKFFFLLNIIGSFLAAYASYLIHYWPFVILESCWCLISLINLTKLFHGLKQHSVHDN